MILLFRDSSVNFWLNNTIVDCGIAETQNNILDIELPEDISSDENETNNITDIEITNDKKLNKKLEHNQDNMFNESKHKKVYFGRNTKVTNGNSRKKDSGCDIDGYKYKYKDSNIRINDIQKTTEYQCVSKYPSTNFNQRKMREMPKTSNLYNYE